MSEQTRLLIPNNAISESLSKIIRDEYENRTRDEIPKLTNVRAVIAFDYYKYGWEDANRFSKQLFLDDKKDFVNNDFNIDDLQKAVFLCLSGTVNEKKKAREYLSTFINRL